MQQALVLEKKQLIKLRGIEVDEPMGPHDVRIKIHTVGICGSDVHYYQWGKIGPFVVNAPMILGHEASGTIIETGSAVTNLKVGDRVCMEPGVPDPNSRATRMGIYNCDPGMKFWATPPCHGCLRPTVVHPAAFTFKVPDNVSFAEAAMVEPLAVGMQAAKQAHISPGDVAVVIGAGPIGMVTALAALAGGCSRVFLADVQQPKLDLGVKLGPIVPVNVSKQNLGETVRKMTDGWGADIVFEASGNEKAASGVFEPLCIGGRIVFIGLPGSPIQYDIVQGAIREARIEHVFRYAHVYPRTIALLASGKIDVKPLITDNFVFADSVKAFDFAVNMPPTSVKAQIVL
jgi:D-xylulose reductase